MRRLVMASTFCVSMILTMVYVFPAGVSARPCHIQDVIYFDSSCSEEVGETFIQCDGTNIHWGDTTPTPYFVQFNYCCGNNSCGAEGSACGGEGDYLGCGVSGGCAGTLCCGSFNGGVWLGPC